MERREGEGRDGMDEVMDDGMDDGMGGEGRGGMDDGRGGVMGSG